LHALSSHGQGAVTKPPTSHLNGQTGRRPEGGGDGGGGDGGDSAMYGGGGRGAGGKFADVVRPSSSLVHLAPLSVIVIDDFATGPLTPYPSAPTFVGLVGSCVKS
jgi:hypothetical protein